MNKVYFLSASIWTILIITDVETLKISEPSTCNTTITCAADEACYQESIVSGQTKIVTLGCINNKQCGASTTDSLTVIGRDIKRRQEQKCLECCGTDRCNEILCAHRNPAACIDDETIDCPRMNSVFGICKDINHAKSLCPDFCNLCGVVDGVWTEWTLWSTCDVTCETGIQSRSRTCTNPAPAHGGQDCVGNQAETKQCQKSLCPVHGHWSSWEAWGACSVSCGLGIQRRQRTCTNPAPQRFGDHCFGLNIDDRICVPKACSDGEWTNWGNWSSCSVTCGGGFQSRSRSCTNPRPSLIGRYCDGDSSQVGSCNRHACRDDGVWTEWTTWSTCDITCEAGIQSRSRTCTNLAPAHGGQYCVGNQVDTKQCQKSLCPVHGHWSSWEAWGTCSVSCGIGIQSRQRTCTNPAPQRFGDHCFGLNMDDRTCIPKACSDVAFRCNGMDLVTYSNMTFKFRTVSLNEGNGFDNNTGEFTAPVAGTYLFSTQLCVNQGYDVVYAIVVDNVNVKVGHFNDKDWTFCHSADTVAVLRRTSRAWVKCITCDKYALVERENFSNTFFGALVHN